MIDVILHDDCIAGMAALPSKSVDLVFADPPYNLQLQYDLHRPDMSKVDAVRDDWDHFDSFREYDDFTAAWLTQCRRVMKDDASIWVIGSYHNIFRVGRIMMDLGFWILNDVIWYKTNPMPNFNGSRFQNATETMIWAKKSQVQKKYTFNYHAMKNINEDRQMGNFWRIPLCAGLERLKKDGKKAHPTQKPEQLLYRVLLSSSAPGDLVLDPFMGTGTTAAVAKKLRRHFIGFDSHKAYVELARERIAEIETALIPEGFLVTRSKRDNPKVSFGQIVESGLLNPGDLLYSKDRRVKAVILADSKLQTEFGVGSIHKAGAAVAAAPACNGWEFWHYAITNDEVRKIDELRQFYLRETMGVPAVTFL